jgi:hypothetical protein
VADPDDIKLLLFPLLNDKKFDQTLKKVNEVCKRSWMPAALYRFHS